MGEKAPELIPLAKTLSAEIARIHGEDSAAVMAAERYTLAAKIAKQISIFSEVNTRRGNRLDNLSLHPVVGYILFLLLWPPFWCLSPFSADGSRSLSPISLTALNPHLPGALETIFWNGAVTGVYAALAVALGFILPFFLISELARGKRLFAQDRLYHGPALSSE